MRFVRNLLILSVAVALAGCKKETDDDNDENNKGGSGGDGKKSKKESDATADQAKLSQSASQCAETKAKLTKDIENQKIAKGKLEAEIASVKKELDQCQANTNTLQNATGKKKVQVALAGLKQISDKTDGKKAIEDLVTLHEEIAAVTKEKDKAAAGSEDQKALSKKLTELTQSSTAAIEAVSKKIPKIDEALQAALDANKDNKGTAAILNKIKAQISEGARAPGQINPHNQEQERQEGEEEEEEEEEEEDDE